MYQRHINANREVRLLETIAVALTTGNPGDVFAATFDRREGMELVLARNGLPTSEDIAAANELLSLIASPTVKHSLHLFPFLMKRCGANINKRIRKLHVSIQSTELRSDFTSALEAYVPEADVRVEFPGSTANHLLETYGDGPFLTVWNDLIERITNMTSHGVDAEDPLSSRRKYAELVIHADALARSRFLKSLVDECGPLKMGRKERVERAEKLKRQLGKVCQYMLDISHLIKKAKRLLPIPHRWVTDAFADTGEGVYELCDSPHDAVARGLGRPLSPENVDKLHERFPNILSNWKKRKTVHACIHAELRIILHFNRMSAVVPLGHPIGVSKRSCLCCTLWIALHKRFWGTEWLTSGSNGKPCADWALPGGASSGVSPRVLGTVSAQLEDALDELFPGQRVSGEDYVSELALFGFGD